MWLSQGFVTMLSLMLVVVSAAAGEPPYASKAAHQGLVEFAPGVISTTTTFDINTVFNPVGDQVIFSRCNHAFSHCTMMQSDYRSGQWQPPRRLPFSGDYLDADPYYNAAGSMLYFISKRPIHAGGKATETVNLWRVSRSGKSWGRPEYLAHLSSAADDLYPSLTASGDLYFPSFRQQQRLMYVAKATSEGFAPPQAIDATVYGEGARMGDSMVTRDGKTLIFSLSGRADSLGKGDLYISHWKNQRWTLAKSLGARVNSADHEFTPILSPNGEYLFFTRIEQGLGNLYQIHISLLDWE